MFEPESGAYFTRLVRLKWTWDRALESHERFSIQWLLPCEQQVDDLWVSEGEIIGSGGNIYPVADGYRFEVNVSLEPYPGGEAHWRVAVFGETPSEKYQISQWSEKRLIFNSSPPQ